MIRVDPRIGSGPFLRLLKRAGLPAIAHPLKYGDFSFWGNGPDGSRVRVGVERKTTSEIVAAITDSRFTGHQLPGLCRRFDYVILVVEGRAYPDPATGILMQGGRPVGHTRQAHLYENVEKFLLTLQLKAGVRVLRTEGKTHTVMALAALYRWFQKPWKAHKSAYVVDETKPDRVLLTHRTLKRQVANQLTGLAWERSIKADRYFPSIAAMVNASAEEWQQALGFKDGMKTARRLYDVCHREDAVPGKGA